MLTMVSLPVRSSTGAAVRRAVAGVGSVARLRKGAAGDEGGPQPHSAFPGFLAGKRRHCDVDGPGTAPARSGEAAAPVPSSIQLSA